jgi:hypothetical protein
LGHCVLCKTKCINVWLQRALRSKPPSRGRRHVSM